MSVAAAMAADDPHQVGARVAHVGPGLRADAVPPQPGFLHSVLGVGRRAEQLVGDGEQQAAVGEERVAGHGVVEALRMHERVFMRVGVGRASRGV